MDWFRCFPSEYCFDTRDLTLAEHGAYTLLLYYMYSTEKPVGNLEEGQRICCARTEEERFCVQRILERFFRETKNGYVHKRVKKEMAYVNAKRKLASKAGKISGSRRAVGYTQRIQALKAKDGAIIRRADRMEVAQSRSTHTAAEWGLMLGFCGGKCLKCGSLEPGKDHVQPISRGGSDGIENLQPLCPQCNTEKRVDTIDYRPLGWREFIEQTLNVRSSPVNGSQQIRLDVDETIKEKPKFIPPTQAEVCAYMHSREIPEADRQAELFVAHHANRKWRLGGGTGPVMMNWKQAVITWQGNIGKYSRGSNGTRQPSTTGATGNIDRFELAAKNVTGRSSVLARPVCGAPVYAGKGQSGAVGLGANHPVLQQLASETLAPDSATQGVRASPRQNTLAGASAGDSGAVRDRTGEDASTGKPAA